MFQCETYEQLYIHGTSPDQALENAVIEAYYQSLLFLASAARHDEQHRIACFAAAPFKVDKMEAHLSSLNECVANISHYGAVCQARQTSRGLTKLQKYLLDATNKLGDISNVL